MSQKVRVGIVGIGAIAHLGHLPNYKNHPDVEITAVADVDFERAQQTAREIGENVKAFSSGSELFASGVVDAVSICTFNDSHISLSVEALQNGLDVLVEKPMATSVEDAEILKQAAKESDRIVMVGMTHRFRKDSQALYDLIQAGDLGHVYYAKAQILRRRGCPSGWFTQKLHSGGGPLMDIGVHALDLAWWLMGKPEPESVNGQLFREVAPYDTKLDGFWDSHSTVNKENPVYDVEDFGMGMIRFKNGAILHLEASWAINGPEDDALKIDLFGSKAGCSLEPLKVYGEQHRLLFDLIPKAGSKDPYTTEINHFIECVQQRKDPIVDAFQGYQVVQMLDGINRSSHKRAEYVLADKNRIENNV